MGTGGRWCCSTCFPRDWFSNPKRLKCSRRGPMFQVFFQFSYIYLFPFFLVFFSLVSLNFHFVSVCFSICQLKKDCGGVSSLFWLPVCVCVCVSVLVCGCVCSDSVKVLSDQLAVRTARKIDYNFNSFFSFFIPHFSCPFSCVVGVYVWVCVRVGGGLCVWFPVPYIFPLRVVCRRIPTSLILMRSRTGNNPSAVSLPCSLWSPCFAF